MPRSHVSPKIELESERTHVPSVLCGRPRRKNPFQRDVSCENYRDITKQDLRKYKQ